MSKESPSFPEFDCRARKGDTLKVVFLGGSLTWGAQATNPTATSYRALTGQKLEETYPNAHFRFWDAAIGGTGSQLAAFRLDRDVLSHKPDLVFLDFTINDDPYPAPDPDKLASYESLVRRMVLANILVLEVILPAKKDVLSKPPFRPLDERHKEIAQAYGLPVADAVALVTARVAERRTTPDELWDAPPDVTHPGDAGYALYAEAAWEAYRQAVYSSESCHVPAKMLYADTYMTTNRIRLSSLRFLPNGWNVGAPNRSAVAFDFLPSRWLDDETIARIPEGGNITPEAFQLRVQGSNIMIFGEATPTSGKYVVRIDGNEPKTYDVGASARQGNLRYFQILSLNLNPHVEHTVELIPQLEPGQELRFESICIAGAPANLALSQKSSILKSMRKP